MERHGIETSHAVAGRDEHHPTPSHSRHNHSHHHHHHSAHGPHTSKFLLPDHAASNLSVPDGEGPGTASGTSSRLHRGSSLKLSRKRPRSFGPGQKKRPSFQRSGSVDTPMKAEAEGGVGETTPRLLCAKSDTLATNSPSTLSVAAASLAVAFGGQTPKVLTLQVPPAKASPVQRPANLTLKECYSVKLDKAPAAKPSTSSSLNPPSSRPAAKDSLAPPAVSEGPVGGGRGPLTSVEVHMSDHASPCPPTPNVVTEATPTPTADTAVGGAVAGAGTLKPTMDTERLELPSASDLAQAMNGSWSTESLLGDSDVNPLPSPDQPNSAAAGPSHQLVRPFDLLDCGQRSVFHQQVPPQALSLRGDRTHLQEDREEGATAMQLGVPKAPLLLGAPVHQRRRPDARDSVDIVRRRVNTEEARDGSCTTLESGLRELTLEGLAGATGISGNFNDENSDDDEEALINEVEVMTEDEDVVFAGDSHEHVQQYLAALPRNRAVAGLAANLLQHGLPSPDELEEDLLLMGAGSGSASASGTAAATPAAIETLRRNKRGSTGSHSQASSSGSKAQMRGSVALQGGKLKTPTTPLSWMVLRSPLARIESFHSDDFEYYNSSDNEPAEHTSVASASPMSASTPTVPCFAYRLNIARKKPPKLKKATTANSTDGKASKKAGDKGAST